MREFGPFQKCTDVVVGSNLKNWDGDLFFGGYFGSNMYKVHFQWLNIKLLCVWHTSVWGVKNRRYALLSSYHRETVFFFISTTWLHCYLSDSLSNSCALYCFWSAIRNRTEPSCCLTVVNYRNQSRIYEAENSLWLICSKRTEIIFINLNNVEN